MIARSKGCRHVMSMVDGHPYKVEVVGSSPTVPIHLMRVSKIFL